MPSSIIGAVGLARQSAKGTAATTANFFPATSSSMNPNQQAQTLPPEIGGSYLPRAAYKSSVMGSGDMSFIPRPNTLGQFLYALCGQDAPTTIASQNGMAFQHVLTPFVPASGVDLPWYTLVKDISKMQADKYVDSKLRSLQIDIPKSSIVTAQASWISAVPSTIPMSDGLVSTEALDITPQFQTCLATFSFANESSSPVVVLPQKVERLSLQFTNNLSEDQFSVGDFYLADINLLQRTVNISIDLVVHDMNLYNSVYYNGTAAPASWTPTIYRGTLGLTLTMPTIITGAVSSTYSCAINFPGIDFMALPITLSGADVVRATLTAQVSLGPSGSDQFSFTLINGIAAY